jgi:hypothetical protein
LELQDIRRGSAEKRITIMSVQKKSLIGSRPTEKKEAGQPAKAVGESKSLTASALDVRTLRAMKKRVGVRFRAAKGKK